MKQSALDRLSALKGKDRDEIVRSSALAEWEKTNLFQVHLGREGAALLTEVVLAKCGQSQVDLLHSAINILGSSFERMRSAFDFRIGGRAFVSWGGGDILLHS